MTAYPLLVANALQETSDAPLEAADRCDRCGAQAKVRLQFVAGDLLLCQHHSREHADAIAKQVRVPRSI